MKHQVCAFLLFISFLLCADNDKYTIADKSKRIGRFSYEDSFDENMVEDILKHSPSTVKKNIKRLLCPSSDEDVLQRLLLLGGSSNATTTATAKTIALRSGYEYYVIDAAALLREYREGRQMLLSEVRPVIKSGKPIALIITELPEMADYSGVLASTLWLLIDQCAQQEDVLVIATSAFEKGQLSQDIKERFGDNIIPVVLDKSMQNRIECMETKISWLERNKTACMVAGGVVCFMLAAVHVGAQILFTTMEMERKALKLLLEENKMTTYEKILNVEKELHDKQIEQLERQCQQWDIQQRQYSFVEDNIKDEVNRLEKLQTQVENLNKKAEKVFSHFRIQNS